MGCDRQQTRVVPAGRGGLLGYPWIVEGLTDAAAAIDLGSNVIGRPASLGCEDMIVELVRQHGASTMLIIADADGPGQRGAK